MDRIDRDRSRGNVIEQMAIRFIIHNFIHNVACVFYTNYASSRAKMNEI